MGGGKGIGVGAVAYLGGAGWVEEAVGEDKDAGEWGAGRMSGTRSGWWWCSGDGGVDGS